MSEKITMPGFKDKAAKDAAAAKAARDWKRAAADAERHLQMRRGKIRAIDDILPLSKSEIHSWRARIGAVASSIKVAVLSQLIFFAAGSGLHYFDTNDGYYEEDVDGVTMVHTPANLYHGVSYGQAIKNAYLFDDLIHGNKGGTWQAIAGLVAILVSLGLGAKTLKDKFDDIESIKSEKAHRQKRILAIYSRLEALKEYGVRVDDMIDAFQDYAPTLVSKMSEMDRGYLENLLNGGLENVNWDVANAIVAGHLKAHPEDYNEIIKIIDESTMDPKLVKKYGRGFDAARAMMGNKDHNK